MMLFQAGWFIESMWSQTLVIHMIRTPKIPFVQSRASTPVILITFIGIILSTIIPYVFGSNLGFIAPPIIYFMYLAIIIIIYICLASLFKKIYIKRYGELL
jgi:Mg2+-importing ATPase